MSRLSASCWMMSRGVLSIARPIVWMPFLTLMVVLNVALSAAQTDVSDVSVDRKVEQISANGAFKSYVEEASQRFLIPSSWIWAVMRVESAGDARALSNKGAIGLMQIMPDTWTMLRQQHGLGDDPYDPRDNILAGASYLRDLHHRYGQGGFLAAYNAGPRRYEEHLSGRRSLPAETIDYVSKVSRLIGSGAPSDRFLTAHPGSGAAESDLFVRPGFGASSDQEADDNRFNNHVSVSPKSDQRIVDLSAITPQASGLFVRLSDRRQLNQD
jgi:Transglycosylase SLT domain